MKQEPIFGGISYEYAIGCIQASSRPPLSKEQWNRFRPGDFSQALGLLRELGCPVRDNFLEALEEDWQKTASFVREISPRPELTQVLFFEEDALNLKLYRKAVLGGLSQTGLPVQQGSLEPELLWVCAENNDYSLLGEELENALSPLQDTADPCRVSCVIDNAFFARAKSLAKQERSASLTELLEQYGRGKNRLTAWRLDRMGLSFKDIPFAFLPTVEPVEELPSGLSQTELLEQVNEGWNAALEEAGWGDPMGVIAGYFFQKKWETKALGLLLCEKKTAGGMTG